MSTICFEIVYASPAGPKPGQTGLKPGFFGHFPGFFGSIPGRKCYNIVIFLPHFFCRFCPTPQKEGPAPSRAGPTLAILAVLWVRLLCLFANPGRRLQRPRPRPGLVTLAKLSRRFLCAFPSRGRPRRPTFGYFSYILAANPGRFRQSRPAAPAPSAPPGFGHPGQTQPPVSMRFPQPRPASPPHFWLF